MSWTLVEPPERVEEVWGVELDDMGSVDYYDNYEDALEDCFKYGYRLVRVQTEWYTPVVS